MRQRLRKTLSVVLAPNHLVWTGTIALVVGSWLTLMNQANVILAGAWSAGLAIKIGFNYLTPFVTSNLGLVGRT